LGAQNESLKYLMYLTRQALALLALPVRPTFENQSSVKSRIGEFLTVALLVRRSS